jgi:hypothetical protein
MKRLGLALLGAGVSWLIACGGIAQATTLVPALQITNPSGSQVANPPFTFGWEFSTSGDVTVGALGVFDGHQDGLVDSHQIGLWDSVGNFLAVTTVSSGTTDPLVNQFRYASITPVTLVGGQNYVIGALYPTGSDDLIFPGQQTGQSTVGGISYIQSLYTFGSALSVPATATGLGGYFGPNFEIISATQTPLPAALPLFATGVGALGLLGWRRRRRAQVSA